jgi:hypothetical protein
MQTFMKMAGAVYTMAGLGTIEESKLFKDKFDAAMGEREQVLYILSIKHFLPSYSHHIALGQTLPFPEQSSVLRTELCFRRISLRRSTRRTTSTASPTRPRLLS